MVSFRTKGELDMLEGMVCDYSGGNRDERNFARSLRNEWNNMGGWVDQYHPSLGSTTGQPDLQFLLRTLIGPVLVPVELKVGEIVKGNLKVHAIRPAQRRWAKKFHNHGGKSGFLCGIEGKNGWCAAVLNLEAIFEGAVLFKPAEFTLVETIPEALLKIRK